MQNPKLTNFFNYVKDKEVAVVGIGISNTPIISMLVSAGARVTAYDKTPQGQLGDIALGLKKQGVKLHTGPDYLENLNADIIFKTPSMRFDNPYLIKAKKAGSVITSEMEVFFDLCPCKIIGITGSDGKTTTTSLIYELLKISGKKVHLGGNIGKPILGRIADINDDDYVVVELSSFQLQTMKKSPHIAVVTNVSPNHLDIHKSMDEYVEAKSNIFRFQAEDDILVVNWDNEITRNFVDSAKGSVLGFSLSGKLDIDGAFYDQNTIYIKEYGANNKLLERQNLKLRGDHNVDNFMAAVCAVKGICSSMDMEKVALSFGGVRHRIEFVREHNGVRYYNDSIGSSPTRTIATLKSFEQKVALIAGGDDKKLPFDKLGAEVLNQVSRLYLTGDTALKIKAAVESAPGYDSAKLPIKVIDDFDTAVLTAAKESINGDIVLLSPACASFDKFKNFEQRGDRFVQLIKNLK